MYNLKGYILYIMVISSSKPSDKTFFETVGRADQIDLHPLRRYFRDRREHFGAKSSHRSGCFSKVILRISFPLDMSLEITFAMESPSFGHENHMEVP